MRLAMMSISLALVSITMLAQQPNAANETASKPTSAVSAHATIVHHRARRKVYSAKRRGAKRHAYRPEYTQNSVEVMNGSSTQKVVFREDQTARSSGKDRSPKPMKVEVVNGNSTDTQYFSAQATAQENAAQLKQPVVVAIQSSDTRTVGGNKHPVVTSITAVQPGSAKSASDGGPRLATGVAPRPKRPACQPDAH